MDLWRQTIVALLLCAVVGTTAHAQQTEIKIATIAPEGSAWMNSMRDGAAQILKRTDGRVKIKYFGGGVMGNDKKVLRKMRFGQLHGGAFVSSGLAERYADIQLYGLPLLFNNQAEADFVRNRLDDQIKSGMEKSGLVCLGLASGGFAKIMSAAPVRSADDLKGQKVWVPEGDLISYAAMERLGLSPVTLPITDVLAGLQTGLIDIIGTSSVGAVVLQWHTKVKYVTNLPISYLYGILAVEQKTFDKLSAGDQQIVREVFDAMYARFEVDNLVDDEKALDALVKSGIEVVQPVADMAPMLRAKAAQLRSDLAADGVISKDKLQAIDSLLTKFRSTPRSAASDAP